MTLNRFTFLFLIAFLAVISREAYAQNKEIIQTRIADQVLLFPQEKLYLQTDKSCYVSGEKLWFRAHLVDEILHTPSYQSSYIFVELLNPLDSVICRARIKSFDGVFHGMFSLPVALPEGNYILRAYTDNLQSLGSGYFFHRQIEVLSSFSGKYQLQTVFECRGDRVRSKFTLFDKTKQKIVEKNEFTIQVNNQPSEKFYGNSGTALVSFRLSPEENKRVLYVETSSYRKYLIIPYPEDEYDISFYPEGGYLLSGVEGTVAFKALHSDGSPAVLNGKIVDDVGKEYVQTTTLHEGMGKFSLLPEPDKKYFLECEDEKGNQKKFELPSSQDNFYSLQLKEAEGRLLVSVLHSGNLVTNSDLYLMLHTRGMIHHFAPWDAAFSSLSFNASIFPSGVMQVLLLDSTLNPLSERLFFCNNAEQATLKLQSDKTSYDSRSLVKAELKLTDERGMPLTGSFSVAVTDNLDVLPDTTVDILSSLLLDADLKGYIPNPSYYLKEGNAEALDLLMLTHGWRRYSIPDIIREKYTLPCFPNRHSMEIRGLVKKGIRRKPVKKSKVSAFSWQADYIDETITDSAGHFIFKKFEAPDSITFVVQALSAKNSNIELILEEEDFPTVTESLFYSPWEETKERKSESAVSNWVEKSNIQYAVENGMRKILLEEVEISAKRIEKKKESYSYYMPKKEIDVLDSKELEEIQPASLSDVIMHLPFVGVKVIDSKKKVYIERMKYKIKPGPIRPASLVIDDIVLGDYDLDNIIDPFNVEKIGVLKGTAASYLGGDGAGGAIVITTKKGMADDNFSSAPNHIKKIKPLGFQCPVEFYSPKYETEAQKNRNKPDYRTTIYWNPNIKVPESGKVDFDFYTADLKTNYSVVVEGVTDNGKIVHGEYQIVRE